jgi:hypothetical protein
VANPILVTGGAGRVGVVGRIIPGICVGVFGRKYNAWAMAMHEFAEV